MPKGIKSKTTYILPASYVDDLEEFRFTGSRVTKGILEVVKLKDNWPIVDDAIVPEDAIVLEVKTLD